MTVRGRKRRKPATNGTGAGADGENGSVDEVVEDEPVAEATPAEPDAAEQEPGEQYVPMSEWIEDFDSRSRSRSA